MLHYKKENIVLSNNVDGILSLLGRDTQADSIFVKPTLEEVLSLGGEPSAILVEGNNVVGLLLIDGDYVNTILSECSGGATELVKHLKGVYRTHVAYDNDSSLRFFKKYKMIHIKDEVMSGQLRGLYEVTFL